MATKQEILEDAGYRYSFDREVYFNRSSKKAFSVAFIEDHAEDEIQRHICEDGQGTEWRFFFNSPPSIGVRRELSNVLG